MIKTILKLDEFLCSNDIKYMITGTMALHILGMPSSYAPNDIDVKVSHLTKEQIKKLKELQALSGLENDEYGDGKCVCYSFKISSYSCDMKVNVLHDDSSDLLAESACVIFSQMPERIEHPILVQRACYALRDKKKLNRVKDVKYILDLVNILTNEI